MGKIRTKVIGDEEAEKKQKAKDEARREAKSQKAQRVTENAENKISVPSVTVPSVIKQPAKTISKQKSRSKRYLQVRTYIDHTKSYPVLEAIDLIKNANLAKFDATVEAHINTSDKDIKGSASLPHGIGRKIRVAVVDDKLLSEVEAGKINFDILISHTSFMPKLARLAKILGPKGLMPNPKAGTISDKPKETAKKFEGLLRFKSESDFPIIHTVIGKASFDNKKLAENFDVLTQVVGLTKIKNVFIKTSMSPSVRVQLDKLV